MGDFVRDALAAIGAATLGCLILDDYRRQLDRELAQIEQLQRELEADAIDLMPPAAAPMPLKLPRNTG